MNRIHLSLFAALLVFVDDAIAQNAPPIVTNQIADFTEYAGAVRSIDLTSAFADQDVSAAVRLTTVLGAIDLALFGQQKPITVANFLNYLDQAGISKSIRRPANELRRSSIGRFPDSSSKAAVTSAP